MARETRNLVLFLVATFAWTWALYIPIVLSGHSQQEMPWMILLILGGAGPSIVGVLMVLLTCDKPQRLDYFRRCFSLRRITPAWWLLILLIFPAILLVTTAADLALGGALPGMDQLKGLVANPVMWPLAAFISFMSGPWSEEFGWRGYALDRCMDRFGAVRGAVGLGVIWAVWHLPLFFMPYGWHGQIGFKLTGFWTFILLSIGLSLLMAWVYRGTNRSILSAMLMHFTSNFSAQLVAPASEQSEVLRTLLIFGVGVVVWVLLHRRATARPLSWANG